MTFLPLILLSMPFVFCLHYIRCSRQSRIQRERLMLAIRDYDSWRLLSMGFSCVSYQRHLAELLRFRNPWKLYFSALRRLVGEE